jgi:hypothetical protein
MFNFKPRLLGTCQISTGSNLQFGTPTFFKKPWNKLDTYRWLNASAVFFTTIEFYGQKPILTKVSELAHQCGAL